VAHCIAKLDDPPFEHIVWFSARDVDLRSTGSSEVRPSVIDLESVSQRFGQLFSDWGGETNTEALANALQSPIGVSSKGILFIFDNFETFSDVKGLHKFLDEHTHLPNKALITSGVRAFVADYPIEVRGMESEEAERMLINTAKTLGIENLMIPETIDRIYEFTGGHAYVMRILVGEMAKDGRYTPPALVMGRRGDIVDAVFQRSFNKLSESGRTIFLLVANWKSNIPEIGLLVVLGVRGVDVIEGLDECCRLSLVNPVETSGEENFYSVPQLARGFAKKKLQGDPDRLVIQQDMETLQKFGVASKLSPDDAPEQRLIDHFIKDCFENIGKAEESVNRADKLLEALACSWPTGWSKLAKFRERTGVERQLVYYALRRAVEEQPFSKDAWLDRARYAEKYGNDGVRVSSLVSAVDADPSDVELVSDVALKLCQYIHDHIADIPETRRGVYLASVRSHMERIANKLTATGLSRLAWLFLLENKKEDARRYAGIGCKKDPHNHHCLRIIDRLDAQL